MAQDRVGERWPGVGMHLDLTRHNSQEAVSYAFLVSRNHDLGPALPSDTPPAGIIAMVKAASDQVKGEPC
jgi:hypothetical protein